MTLFLDVHNINGVTREAAAAAHQRDLEVQDRYNVKMVNYWLDEANGKIFCLAEAPSREAANEVHREAHGLLADEIFEVAEGE
ncbi:MAG: DUF4242 domain-containing protein [Chloroflexi bacterium]|nr:DUF4242 domain-containing protein [Chloroflexota bacterium]MBV9547094.1 DUF4242 domain-containing protein [Chloroflexota bacterium]